MPLRGPYAPLLPELAPFLFASVGEEVNGIPLSVLSALSRLSLDPWDEAARLSHLAGEAAADQLARTIARLPDRHWTAAERQRIVAGLIALLPPATKSGKDDEGTGNAYRKVSSRPSLFLIQLALVGTMLIGLFALGALSFGGHRQTVQPGSQADSESLSRAAR